MKPRSFSVLLPALLAGPILAASLGGWATITVEDLPEHIVVGQPVELTYTVRQHGVDRLRGLKGEVEARLGRVERTTPAGAGSEAGQYTATVTLPEPGNWTILIRSGFGKSNSKLLPIRAVPANARVAAMAPAERGKHLFVAKGCVGCHIHQNVGAEAPADIGPDLTTQRFQADYLVKYLRDPSIKTPTTRAQRMPDLELKDPEIAALVAFLNAGSGKAVTGER
jgi:cytochrome c553